MVDSRAFWGWVAVLSVGVECPSSITRSGGVSLEGGAVEGWRDGGIVDGMLPPRGPMPDWRLFADASARPPTNPRYSRPTEVGAATERRPSSWWTALALGSGDATGRGSVV